VGDIDPAAFHGFTLELGRAAEIGLAITLATMMFSVALGLRVAHFGFFRKAPYLFVAGVLSQLIGLPLMTLALCYVVVPDPSVALGMILVACCPGGNVSNMLVLLARGDAALSISLTATSSVVAAFLTPVSILFWSSLYAPTAELLGAIDFNAIKFLLQTAIVLALPLLVGMLLARFAPVTAEVIRKPLIALSACGLILITVYGLVKYWQPFVLIGTGLFALVILHNSLAFTLGYLVSRLVKASVAARRAITFEVGIQNSGLGIVILLTQMSGLGAAVAIVGLWGVWHVVAGLLLVILFRNSTRL